LNFISFKHQLKILNDKT